MSDNNPIQPIPSTEQMGSMLELMKDVLKSPAGKRKLIASLGGGILETRPYYNKESALEVKDVFDAMMADGLPREYLFSEFAHLYKPNTLLAKVQQASKYLVENLDTEDKKYLKFRSTVEIIKRETGVFINFKDCPPRLGDNDKPILSLRNARIVGQVREGNEGWKQKLQEFILEEKKNGDARHFSNLSLTEDEIEFVNSLFIGNEEFYVSIKPTEMKIIYDPEGIIRKLEAEENENQTNNSTAPS